jgi:hypothetical protein
LKVLDKFRSDNFVGGIICSFGSLCDLLPAFPIALPVGAIILLEYDVQVAFVGLRGVDGGIFGWLIRARVFASLLNRSRASVP